jgi:hypothetical protein
MPGVFGVDLCVRFSIFYLHLITLHFKFTAAVVADVSMSDLCSLLPQVYSPITPQGAVPQTTTRVACVGFSVSTRFRSISATTLSQGHAETEHFEKVDGDNPLGYCVSEINEADESEGEDNSDSAQGLGVMPPAGMLLVVEQSEGQLSAHNLSVLCHFASSLTIAATAGTAAVVTSNALQTCDTLGADNAYLRETLTEH